jgi:cytoskeletal protein CcmA (bactofilin family)
MILSTSAALKLRPPFAAHWPEGGTAPLTVIHADMTVVGHIMSDGHIEIHGAIQGTINCHSVTIGEAGYVEGTILADVAYIGGAVNGPIRANTVTIGKAARVVGNVFHNVLNIEPGAYMEGRRPWRPNIDRKS